MKKINSKTKKENKKKNTIKKEDKKIKKEDKKDDLIQNSKEFIIKRILNAPRELVFKAWTNPKHMEHWWGPMDFEIPVCKMDVRPGGAYRIVMRSKDDVDYPIKGEYQEVIEPRKLVMTQDTSEHPDEWKNLVESSIGPDKKKIRYDPVNPVGEVLLKVLLEDLNGKTNLVIRIMFESSAIRDAMVNIGMNDGWSQSLDRLSECIEKYEMTEIYDF